MLSVEDLHVRFGTERGLVYAVNGISFEIAPGETLGIVGESGCGKSVTSLALLGILSRNARVTSGRAIFEGQDLLALSDEQLRTVRGREIAMIFQDPMTSLNPVLTIGRQIREALETHFGLDRAQARTSARPSCSTRSGSRARSVRLKDYPHQFSGGMRQRAMIAMALACEPKLLIADEPTTALDVTIQAQILELLRSLVAELDTALILITHDLGVVAGMCERVNVMYAGMFVETGSAERALRAAAPPVHARPAPERAAARCRPPPAAAADPRRAAEHAEPAGRVPVRAPLPLRGRGVASGGAAARGSSRPATHVRCFNPVPADEWQRTRLAARRERDERARTARARRRRRAQGLVPDPQRPRARPARRRRQGRRRRLAPDPGAARRSGSSASRAAASRRSAARSSVSTSRPAARSSSTGPDITHLDEEALRPLRRADADDLPGSVRLAEPAAFRRPHGRRAAARPRPSAARRREQQSVRELLDDGGACPPTRPRGTRTSSPAASASAIGLARALALNPDFIVCDEPVSALDVSIQAQIVNLLELLQTEFDLTYLFIAHDLAVVRHISDRIAVMYLGQIMELSPADDLYDNPLHPYTISLLSAIPIPDPEVERKRTSILLQGDLPSPANPPEGCRFHTRCPYVQPTRCRDEEPELRPVDTHLVKCHFAEEIKAGKLQPQVREVVFEPGAQPRRTSHRRSSPGDAHRDPLERPRRLRPRQPGDLRDLRRGSARRLVPGAARARREPRLGLRRGEDDDRVPLGVADRRQPRSRHGRARPARARRA